MNPTEKPLIPPRPLFSTGVVFKLPPIGEHDFRPPLVKLNASAYTMRCVRCGELATDVDNECRGTSE